jgi:hypothetical protein
MYQSIGTLHCNTLHVANISLTHSLLLQVSADDV